MGKESIENFIFDRTINGHMEIDCIPFRDTGYFSPLICDYLDQSAKLNSFYHNFSDLKGFEAQIKEKGAHFPQGHRIVLQKALMKQYLGVKTTKATKSQLEKLVEANTFTIVTGHQLNLFTGPLYFLYKIISAINLTKELKKAYPNHHFVPVYWMATEDHDFEEINYFNFKGKKIKWNREAGGAVGRMKTAGLEAVLETFAQELGPGQNSNSLKELFKKAYLENDTLTKATRYLANELFGAYGLVIVDGDDPALKALHIPYVKKEILEHTAFKSVGITIEKLEEANESYKIQVNPREINYFYLNEGLRERLEERNGQFHVLNTQLNFSREEILQELEQHPERFSPNVITRPLYQEVILPNLCYIGGGGELAYWMQLKASFEAMDTPFPILLLRNSALLISEKQKKKTEKLKLNVRDLFLKQNTLINKKIREISNIEIDFSPQKKLLEDQFIHLYDLAVKTDKTFLKAVKAQEVKQKKGLDKLEKRLLKAQKRKLKDHVVRMTVLQNELFPNQSLQERTLNFSELYLELGDELIPLLQKSLQPLQLEFTVITY